VPAAVLTAIWAPELALSPDMNNWPPRCRNRCAWRWRLTFVTIAAGLASLHLFHWLLWKRFVLGSLLFLWPLIALAAELPQKVASIEGVTEYRLPNGLKVLTIPEPGADTITVHIVYLVGSRHEGYGEKGMAHLLEHMLFKGSKNFPDVKAELTRRGGRWNGTTSNDRTN